MVRDIAVTQGHGSQWIPDTGNDNIRSVLEQVAWLSFLKMSGNMEKES